MFQCFLSEVSTPLGLKLHTIAPTRVFHAKCFPTFCQVVESIWKPEPVALPTEYNLTEFHSTFWSAWKQDFQGTYINTTVVLLIEVCVSGVTQQMNKLQTAMQYTPLQTSKVSVLRTQKLVMNKALAPKISSDCYTFCWMKAKYIAHLYQN